MAGIRFGIQARLMGGVVLAACLLSALFGWYWLHHEEDALDAALHQRQIRMASIVARGFSAPLWNVDTTTIANLLDAVMADPEVHAIEIHAAGIGAAPMLRERARAAVEPLRLDFDIVHTEPGAPEPKLVGRATLVYTREQVLEKVGETRDFIVELLAGVLTALLVTTGVMLNLLVKRPVSRLGQLAGRVAAGELGARAEVEHHDEIGQLTEQFNAMSAQLQFSSEGLRASEARYRGLFEHATEGIFQIDASGRLLDINRALAQMLGFPDAERPLRLQRPLTQLVRADSRALRRIAMQLLRERRVQQWPLLIESYDGRPLWIELSARLVPVEAGAPRRIEGMVSDISLRHLAEEELKRHRDHLEELVHERTLELSEAKQRAEAANQSKSRFLATMSHEFRTPLNAILGFTQLLQMDASVGPPQQAKVALIRDSGEHLLGLIADVLDMASIEAGKVRLQPAPLDLRALLEVVADSVRVRAELKSLRFATEFDTLPQRVLADGQRLRQVLLNLLSNAVKFTDAGEVVLGVRELRREGSRARLRLAVRDTGIGMSPEQVARLFQPFEQVSEASRRAGGTGLGLSISQELVRLMGGQIEVASTPGQGSLFSVEVVLQVLD
ncbi:MAG: PAS domain S-box protein [Pelomonas sp.]|nr:PAS domain S-box protein [Roseateles sp.]